MLCYFCSIAAWIRGYLVTDSSLLIHWFTEYCLIEQMMHWCRNLLRACLRMHRSADLLKWSLEPLINCLIDSDSDSLTDWFNVSQSSTRWYIYALSLSPLAHRVAVSFIHVSEFNDSLIWIIDALAHWFGCVWVFASLAHWIVVWTRLRWSFH